MDDAQTEEQDREEVDALETDTTDTDEAELVIEDVESAADEDVDIGQLQEQLEERRDEIEELQDLLLDLSARVANDGGTGVCPDCHGAVVKMRRWFRPTTIECQRCGRVFHEF